MKLSPSNCVGGGTISPALAFPVAPAMVARVWSFRERIEYEAADCFARLAGDLSAIYGSDAISRLAEAASVDELRHATLCRSIIDYCGDGVPRQKPDLGVILGPASLPLRERALYTCVAVSCVTETLSTALLIEMKKRAQPAIVRSTVHSILEDEVSHSRLGWAHLAREANQFDLGWLAPFIPAMIRDAFLTDVGPMVSDPGEGEDLSAWGILPMATARPVMVETVNEVILPGLRQFGIIGPPPMV